MFKNTRELVAKTAKDVKILISIPSILEPFILLFSIIYQTYMFITDKALAYVHLALLILVALNFVFKVFFASAYAAERASLFVKRTPRQRAIKKSLKVEKKIYNVLKYTLRLILIIASVVSIARAPSIIKIVATMVIFTELIIELAIFIIGNIVEYKWSRLQSAFYDDLATLSEPIKVVKTKAQQVKDTVIDIFGGFFGRKGKPGYNTVESTYIDSEEDQSFSFSEEETV